MLFFCYFFLNFFFSVQLLSNDLYTSVLLTYYFWWPSVVSHTFLVLVLSNDLYTSLLLTYYFWWPLVVSHNFLVLVLSNDLYTSLLLTYHFWWLSVVSHTFLVLVSSAIKSSQCLFLVIHVVLSYVGNVGKVLAKRNNNNVREYRHSIRSTSPLAGNLHVTEDALDK